MHNYLEQFNQLVNEGRVYYYNYNSSYYFYFLFKTASKIIGKDLEKDACAEFYKWDAYNETGDREDIATNEEAKQFSMKARVEQDLLWTINEVVFLTNKGLSGYKFWSHILPHPEILRRVLWTTEETKGDEDSYVRLSGTDIKAFRRGYVLAQQARLMDEYKTKSIQSSFLFGSSEPNKD